MLLKIQYIIDIEDAFTGLEVFDVNKGTRCDSNLDYENQ